MKSVLDNIRDCRNENPCVDQQLFLELYMFKR